MELKEYIKILKKNYKLFAGSIAVVLILGTAFQFWLKTKYKVELDLNITRTGYQKETEAYRYDEFYRLQADERFADTVVRWLGSNVVKDEIIQEVEDVKFEKLKAERLSSQMIRVSFLLSDKKQAEKLTKNIESVLNDKTSELNAEQKNPQWFRILVSRPVLIERGIDWFVLSGVLLIAGIFVGFWVVLVKHYWE